MIGAGVNIVCPVSQFFTGINGKCRSRVSHGSAAAVLAWGARFFFLKLTIAMTDRSSYQPHPHPSCPASPATGTASKAQSASPKSRGLGAARGGAAAEVSSIAAHLPRRVLWQLFGHARLHHVQKEKDTTAKQKPDASYTSGRPAGAAAAGALLSAQGERLRAGTRSRTFPQDTGAEPGSGSSRNAGQGPLLPPPCPPLFAEP